MPKLSNNLDPDLPKGVHVPPVPGITVQILSRDKKAFSNCASPDKEPITEDEKLSEYFSSRTTTTYLAVTNDTPFSIHLRVDRPYPIKMDCSMLQFEIFIDGKFVWNSWCHRPRYEGNGSVWEEILSGMKLDKGRSCEIKDFKFMGLNTNDACPSYTTFQRIRESMEKIGNIEIKVYRTMSGKKGGDVKNSNKGFLNKNSVEVPEKALRELGERPMVLRWMWDETQLEGMFGAMPDTMVNIPLPSFDFYTAPRVCIIQTDGLEVTTNPNALHAEALKSIHIIDRTPTSSRASSPVSDYHSDSGLTAAQAKQVEDLMKSFRRRTGVGGKSSSRKRIKREDDEPKSDAEPTKSRERPL